MKNQVMTQLEHGVLTVQMNRPDKKNALTADMYNVMADAIERAETDRAIKVLLFTGSDGVFTAGNDLADFRDNPPQGIDAPVNRFIANMVRTDVPIVAAVDGVAVGIGTTMLLHFDQVFATEQARFVMPFINLALVPEAGSSMLLGAACGYQKAAELLLLGEPFSGREALEYGIVAKLCEPATLLEEARAMARKLASKPRAALRASKQLMRRPAESLGDRVAAEMEVFGRRLATPEAREAFTAFFEKRAPDFEQFD